MNMNTLPFLPRLVPVFIATVALAFAGCGSGEQHTHDDGHDHSEDYGQLRKNAATPSPKADATPDEQADHDHAAGEEAHAHHHDAPHGGTLVELGDHEAHLEFVVQEEHPNYKLVVYVLDGGAEKPVRLQTKRISLLVTISGQEPRPIDLYAVGNELTGETVDESSQYEIEMSELKEVSEFKVTIPKISVRGIDYENIAFNFPQGNE